MEPEAPTFYIEAQAIEIISLGDELLDEALGPPAKPVRSRLDDWVDLRLTVDQASLIHEKLRRRIARPSRPRKKPLKVGEAFSDLRYLLDVLWARLHEVPSTTPVSVSKRGNVHVRDREFLLHLRRHERTYFQSILENHEVDEVRRQEREEEKFVPLEELEHAEEGLEPEETTDGIRRVFLYPIQHENPDAHLRQYFLREALSELPAVLKMPAKEADELFAALAEAKGNVSEAARKTGQPQRKTARRIVRMMQHLKRRGFSA